MSDSESQGKKTTTPKNEEGDDFVVWPKTCSICKEPFLTLTITECNHFFCEPCIEKHCENYRTCFVCKKPITGYFRYEKACFIRDPVGPEEIAKQREKAQVEKKAVLELLRERLEWTAGLKIEMVKEGVLAEKAVKIAVEVETLLEKAIEMVMKTNETVGDALDMLFEASEWLGTAEDKMDKAIDLMVELTKKV